MTSISFPSVLPTPSSTANGHKQRPAMRRLATTLESPAGCVRKGCKCDITEAGVSILSSTTTHVDCPSTSIKKWKGELKSPRKFYEFIMSPNIEIADIDRRLLNQFMLQGFESPFDSFYDSKLQQKRSVKVELVASPTRAREVLSSAPFTAARGFTEVVFGFISRLYKPQENLSLRPIRSHH